MYVNCDYYRVFYYVAKYGSLSQAARLLLAGQPNLTRAIRNLEAALGCPLFTRSSRGMRLTPEGERLYAHIRVAFEHIEAGEAELAGSRSPESGTVFLAASEVALRCLLLPVLREYRRRFPGVHLRISNHCTPQAVAALRAGNADLAVVTTPTDAGAALSETPLREVRETAVCPRSFSDLLERRVTLADLAAHPLISLSADSASYGLYAALFAASGLPFCPEIEAATADQLLPLVEAELGVAVLPEAFLSAADPARVAVPELEQALPPRRICLLARREQPLSAAARELESMIRQAADIR